MIFTVFAPGPSLTAETVESVRGRCQVVAVSDVYRLAPWADALVSTDADWWRHHKDAQRFQGKRFGAMLAWENVAGVKRFKASREINSGLLGVMVAVSLGASKILLSGFDLHSPGDHFFGRHPKELKATTPERMEVFKAQFERYRLASVDIVNCTPGSALSCYRHGNLQDEL